MSAQDETAGAARARRGRRAVRLVLIAVVVAAILFFAVDGWLSGR